MANKRQFPTPEGSPTGDADSPVAVTLTPPADGPSLRDLSLRGNDEQPVIPAPTSEPNVRHVRGQRPILEILQELFDELDHHPDAKLIGMTRGKPPRISPGGDPKDSEGFPDSPIWAQHTMEIRFAYRDTVTMARQAPTDQPANWKWKGLVDEQAKQAHVQQQQALRKREHEKAVNDAIKDGRTPPPLPIPDQPAPQPGARPFAYDHLIPKRQAEPAQDQPVGG